MKKKIFCLLLILILPICLLFTGCTNTAQSSKVGTEFKVGNITFIKVANENDFAIFVDKETKVMYLYNITNYQGGLTALLNADGTPMLWEGEL